jgi:hypothetical protein
VRERIGGLEALQDPDWDVGFGGEFAGTPD